MHEAENIIKCTKEKEVTLQEAEMEEKRAAEMEEERKQTELLQSTVARITQSANELEARISAMQRKELK